MTVLPRVTWPSPPMAMAPARRTPRIVVPCGSNFELSLIVGRSAFPSCSRVGTVVNAGKVLEVKMGIDLGCGDIRVPEKFLYAAKFSTGFKKMRSEGMPEEVRMHGYPQALAARPLGDPDLYGTRPQAASVLADEHGHFSGFDQGCALAQPALECPHGLLANRDDARFFAFAEHLYRAVGEIKVKKIKTDELRKAQARGIQKLHQCVIACNERVPRRHIEKPRHLIGVKRVGQASACLRGADLITRICRQCPLAHQIVAEAAHCREAPLNAARCESGGVGVSGKSAHVLTVERGPVRDALAIAILYERRKIAGVA